MGQGYTFWAAVLVLAAVNVFLRLHHHDATLTHIDDVETDSLIGDETPELVGTVIERLRKGGVFTLFAPTKEAFERLNAQTGGALKSRRNKHLLEELLSDHILPSALLSSGVHPTHGTQVVAVSGRSLHITPSTVGGLTVDGVSTTHEDLRVAGGVVHIISEVLVSKSIRGQLGMSSVAADISSERAEAGAAGTQAPEGAGTVKAVKGGGHGGGHHKNKESKEDAPRHHHQSDHPHQHHDHSKGGFADRIAETPFLAKALSPCRGHGDSGADLECSCSVFYTGPQCDQVVSVPGYPQLDGYSGDIALNQRHLETLSSLKVVTPFKTLEIIPNFTPTSKESLRYILPKADTIGETFFNTCALVASSGILMRYDNGEEIDASDMVLRFNSAPTRGYESHVGSKTTYRISNGENIGFREHANETVIHHLRARSFLVKLLFWNIKFPGTTPLAFDPEFTAYVAHSMKFIPSSGYFAVLFALQVCRSVKLYGFHASIRHGARHHYFNTEMPANVQRDDAEFLHVKAMHKAKLLSFAEPCILECHSSRSDCEECLGEESVEELALREKWTPVQRRANEQREKDWKETVKWDWGMDKKWEWDETMGLRPKEGGDREASEGRDSGGSSSARAGGRKRGKP